MSQLIWICPPKRPDVGRDLRALGAAGVGRPVCGSAPRRPRDRCVRPDSQGRALHGGPLVLPVRGSPTGRGARPGLCSGRALDAGFREPGRDPRGPGAGPALLDRRRRARRGSPAGCGGGARSRRARTPAAAASAAQRSPRAPPTRCAGTRAGPIIERTIVGRGRAARGRSPGGPRALATRTLRAAAEGETHPESDQHGRHEDEHVQQRQYDHWKPSSMVGRGRALAQASGVTAPRVNPRAKVQKPCQCGGQGVTVSGPTRATLPDPTCHTRRPTPCPPRGRKED